MPRLTVLLFAVALFAVTLATLVAFQDRAQKDQATLKKVSLAMQSALAELRVPPGAEKRHTPPVAQESAPGAVFQFPSVPGLLTRPVRIPAIREGWNYGWVQLPPGTVVELLKDEGRMLRVKYEETVVLIPRESAQDGTLMLKDSVRL